MTLEQTLTEIEPILRGTDGTFQFTHPSFQEVLTAKQFADEINSGELSVRDAYVNFWSYVEEKKLWGLEDLADDDCRTLLPKWHDILLIMATSLDNDKAQQLIDITTMNYFAAEDVMNAEDYNPYVDDIIFASKIVGRLRNRRYFETDRLLEAIKNEIRKSSSFTVMPFCFFLDINESLLEGLGNIGDRKAADCLITHSN